MDLTASITHIIRPCFTALQSRQVSPLCYAWTAISPEKGRRDTATLSAIRMNLVPLVRLKSLTQ